MLPSICENLMTSASWVVTARITICCWPLRVVVVPAPGDAFAVAFWACGRRREQRAEDLDALDERLDRRGVVGQDLGHEHARGGRRVGPRAAGRRDRRGLDLGHLVGPGDAHDHVHEVAGLDDRADAGRLVDLDGDRDLALGHGDVGDRRRCALMTCVVTAWPFVTGRRAIWPITLLVSLMPFDGKSVMATVSCRHVLVLDRVPERNVARRHDERRLVATPAPALLPPLERDDDEDECDDREEDPDKQDQPV